MIIALKKGDIIIFREKAVMQPLKQEEVKTFVDTLEKEVKLWGATGCSYEKGEIQITFDSILDTMKFKKLFCEIK